MKAEILCVGTELLLGDIVNTNAQFLAKELADLGIFVYYQSVVGDNSDKLKKSLEIAFSRADLVITTGGLGPTKDDLTKEVAANYFNKELILDEKSLNKIKEYFECQKRKMVEGNKKQAYFPKGSIILPNDWGTAPGCIIEENKKTLILLPGPPREMTNMFKYYVIPYLNKYQDGVLISKVLRICGIGESHMEDIISDIIKNQINPTIAPYAKQGEVTLRITARANSKEEAENIIAPIKNEIYSRLSEYIYGEGDTSLEEEVAKLLINKKLTIATAESCTGGLIASKLINYPGVSSVFMEGMVTYSNESKMKRLNVKKETLQKYGAVSEETAIEMAMGIAKEVGTNIGLSVTGIAGPGGASEEKPVGLVFIGLYINGKIKTKKLNLKGSRDRIRNITAIRALDFLRKEILENTIH
ncbi:competence/damage-inducible protein A [Tepidibacter formicigenes]|jgi:nicotinamide-nucleotide amidase|uniref:Putative competence-damage inducible protein n=1 Tax=Tepidibacter formicigenes DSM 15518 TaxID=1123349 RepID=A0A1M6P4F7_9FIRM|nr:competence/damage-inducible protein A [Tepidibacter formicigenes]SHK02808.1 competence/damage-inducible protein cinA [Tepidibacter formicigenes DSM 15518]